MKKTFLSILLLFGFLSFSQSQNLIGKWTRCETFCNGMNTNYNACTFLSFKENNVLIIEFPGKTEILNWSIDNGFLKITSSKLKKSSFFKFDKLYELKYNDKNEVLLFEKGKPDCYEILLK